MNDLQTGFLISMAVVIAVAALIIILFNRLKQPLILGYLVSGMIVGPIVLSAQYSVDSSGGSFIISAQPVVEMLARLGIVLITFSIGLEFSLKQLRKIGLSVITAAALEIMIMIGIGFQLGLALGWSPLEATLLGAMLSVASTMIIVRSLRESGGLDNEKARLVIGLLVVEDFAAVLILAAVSGMVSTGSISAEELGELALKMGMFVAASIVFGLAVVPRLVDYVGRQRSGELLVITVLGLCFMMAVFARWIGMSEAIGAFVMGVIVSESKHIGDVVRKIEPIRDLFGAIFFISVGMLASEDPALFTDARFLATAAAIILVFILAKMFSCTLSTFICGFGARNSFQAGLSMIAIGEFTLMIASVAFATSQVAPGIHLYPTIVLVTTVTALVVPYSVRYTDKATRALEGRVPKSLLYLASYLNLVVRNVRRRSESSVRISNEMMNSISRLFIYIVVVMVTLLVSVSVTQNADEYSFVFGGNTDLLLMIMLAGAIVVVMFAMYGIWSRTTRLIHASTSEAMLGTRSAENIGYEATANSLKWAFLAFYVVVGFIVVSPLIQSIVQQVSEEQSGMIFALVVIVIIAVAVASLWGSLKTIDRKLEEVFEHRTTSPYGDSSRDLTEIEDIITAMERGKP